MTITVDSVTISELAAANRLSAWSGIFNSAFAGAKRIRCYRNGVEFKNVGTTGSFSLTNGNIDLSSLFTSNTTLSNAADLSTGTSTLRIEANGRWLQGSLGLTGSGSDFVVNASFTTVTGFGFSPGTVLSGIQYLPAIPAAPTLDTNAPNSITLEDWTTGSAVTVGSLTFNNRIADYIPEDEGLVRSMGNVRVTQSLQSIIFGTGSYAFEFGATMWSIHAGVNATDNTTPVHQVLIQAKPYGRWSSYPFMDTYNNATDSTFPKPFKIRIKNAAGTTLKIHELHDGKAINDVTLSQTPTGTLPLRPFWHCGMALPWESAKLKLSANASHYFPGMTAESVRPSQAKQPATSNGAIPMFAGNTQINGINQYFGAPQWARAGSSSENATDPSSDTFIYDTSSADGADGTGGYKPRRVTGLFYEAGAIGTHDWYTGPGGVRFDRSTVPTILALFMTNPTGARLKGGELYRDLVDHWRYNNYNHAHHWATNVKTAASTPDADNLAGLNSFDNAYYGVTAKPTSKSIDIRAIVNGGTDTSFQLDKDGKRIWNGWALDTEHSYNQPGWWTLMFNSPMDAYSAKLRYNAQWMAALAASIPNTDPRGYFMGRVGAWRLLHRTMMWTLAANHPLGYKRSDIEIPFVIELETLYDQIVKPAIIDNATDIISTGLRNLGTNVFDNGVVGGDYNGGAAAVTHSARVFQNALCFYVAGVLALMKQTGCWAAMRAKSAKCAAALDFFIYCGDKYSIDYILDTDGREEGYIILDNKPIGTPFVIPTSWAAWATAHPKTGTEDWIHNSTGGFREQDVSMHLRAQYAFMRRDYFPEIANARTAAACTKYQGYYDTWAANVASKTDDTSKRNADWTYRYPPLGIIAAPTIVGE